MKSRPEVIAKLRAHLAPLYSNKPFVPFVSIMIEWLLSSKPQALIVQTCVAAAAVITSAYMSLTEMPS